MVDATTTPVELLAKPAQNITIILVPELAIHKFTNVSNRRDHDKVRPAEISMLPVVDPCGN
jgi:hypothetical protein